MSRPVWYCAKCGGTDIRHDAIAAFNSETQEYEVLGVLDDPWCSTCMNATPGYDEGDPTFDVIWQANEPA